MQAGTSDTLVMDTRELAQKFQISIATLRRILKRGDLDHLRAPINRKFSRKKVEEFINGKSTTWRTSL